MYVIVGANGFLGSYLIKNILEQTDEKIIATARNLNRVNELESVRWEYCDVTKSESVDKFISIIESACDEVKIIYLSAYHHPDEVEKNKVLAWKTNVTGLSMFLEKLGGWNSNDSYMRLRTVCMAKA